MKSLVLDIAKSRRQHLLLMPLFEILHGLLIDEIQTDDGKERLAVGAEAEERRFADAEQDRVDVILQAISTKEMTVSARHSLGNEDVVQKAAAAFEMAAFLWRRRLNGGFVETVLGHQSLARLFSERLLRLTWSGPVSDFWTNGIEIVLGYWPFCPVFIIASISVTFRASIITHALIGFLVEVFHVTLISSGAKFSERTSRLWPMVVGVIPIVISWMAVNLFVMRVFAVAIISILTSWSRL